MKLKENKDILPDSVLAHLIEEQVNQAPRRQETVLHKRLRLLTNMSRSLRSRLNAIIGFSELLAEGGLSQEQQGYNQLVGEAGRSMVTLINNILEYLNMEQGKTGLQIRHCSLEKLLQEIDSVMRPRAEKKGLKFEIIQNGNLPGHIWTDTSHLRQCLVQLAENAITSAEQGSVCIKVYTEHEAGRSYLRFDFEDEGPELNYEKKKAIFEPFMERADDTGGLHDESLWELIITNQLINLLGGKLSVSNRDERGSVFSVVIPAAVSSEQGLGSANAEALRQDRQKQRNEIDELLSDMAGAYGRIGRGRDVTVKEK